MKFPTSPVFQSPLRLIGFSVLIVSGALFALFRFNSAAIAVENDNLSRPLPVRTVTIALTDGYSTRRSFTGRAVPGQVSQLAFEQGGTLNSVRVDLGNVVKTGDLLAEMDTTRLLARRREIVADIEETRANQELAERTLKRAQETFERGHASAQRRDEAEANAIALRARERRLRASLETLDVDIEKSRIYAPYDGVITSRMQDEGNVVAAGTSVLELTQSGSMEAHIGMPPEYAQAIAKGAPVELFDGRRKEITSLAVRQVVPVINGQTRTMMVTFDLPEGTVQRGELVNAVVRDWQNQAGAWLPLRALSADVRGLWRVYKVIEGPNGPKVQFENVQILYSEGSSVFVTGTISDGDQIIADGISRLAPGQRVEPSRAVVSVPHHISKLASGEREEPAQAVVYVPRHLGERVSDQTAEIAVDNPQG